MDARDLNSGPHACMASALYTRAICFLFPILPFSIRRGVYEKSVSNAYAVQILIINMHNFFFSDTKNGAAISPSPHHHFWSFESRDSLKQWIYKEALESRRQKNENWNFRSVHYFIEEFYAIYIV